MSEHSCLEATVVKLTYGETRLGFQIRRRKKVFFSSIFDASKYFSSKSHTAKKNYFKIWHIVIFLIRNLTASVKVSCNIWFLKKNFVSKSCFLKKHEKRKIGCFYGVKWVKTWFLNCKNFFRNWLFFKLQKTLKSKSEFSKVFFFRNLTFWNENALKIWRDKQFYSKSDEL